MVLLSASWHRAQAAGSGIGPLAPFLAAWHHRTLIRRLTRRELEARYRGSMLGALWMIVTPLLMLAVYTFVFTSIFKARWGAQGGGSLEFALLLFSGLILFTIFAECVTRAPGLMLENVSYIKKVVFPLDILPVINLMVALVNAVVSFVILLVFYLPILGLPPPTTLLMPLVVLPLCLYTIGISWFLASVGVYLRDIRQVVGVLVTLLMFLSPIFYPLEAVPDDLRALIDFNPFTPMLEQSKDLLFWGRVPDAGGWLLSLLGGYVFAWLGYAWFVKTRKGFADVM